jgi:bis(5'-nucleosyl)-tetraphosphatase (symmetrical)
VGDVQGCAEELVELIAQARSRWEESFALLFVGDLVNRGPESFRVLATVRELAERGRARLVLGNHELHLIAVALGASPLLPGDSFHDVLERRDVDDWIDWLRASPLLVDGALGATRFALVHAALAPEWTLDAARAIAREVGARIGDPERKGAARFLAPGATREPLHDALGWLVSARSVGTDGTWSELPPSERAGSVPWHVAWSARDHDFGVVYGHWALQGLHVAKRLRGLDTGCVHHGRGRPGFLSAWIPDERAADPFAVPDDRFWQIPARRAYASGR